MDKEYLQELFERYTKATKMVTDLQGNTTDEKLLQLHYVFGIMESVANTLLYKWEQALDVYFVEVNLEDTL